MKHFNKSFTKDSYSDKGVQKSGRCLGKIHCMICTKYMMDAQRRTYKMDVVFNG